MNNISTKYSIDEKKRLAEKIEKTQNKERIDKIKKIIFKENPDVSVTKNSSGMLIYFHNLTDRTYTKILKVFEDAEYSKISTLKKNITDANDLLMTEVGDLTIETENRYRLSNKEKNLLKRSQYEKDIGLTEEPDVYLSDDEKDSRGLLDSNSNTNIFVKKQKTKSQKKVK